MSSHDELLLVKKCKLGAGANAKDGTLQVYRTLLKWTPAPGSGGASVQILPSLITGQQIAKGKPFLRLVTKTGPFVLVFTSEDDVHTVRTLLTNMTAGPAASGAPKPGSVPNAALAAAKQELLEKNEDLKQLYNSLVVMSNTLSEAEFWQSRQDMLHGALPSLTQRQGMSTAMVNTGGKEHTIMFDLSQATIMQIFAEKPHVHKAFMANVPDNMDEKEFWQRYFKHQYAVESRRVFLSQGKENLANKVDDDQAHMFMDADDAELEREARAKVRRVDPTVNLAADQDDGFSEGFGAAHDPRREKAKGMGFAADIMRDINLHSEVVLNGLPANAVPGSNMVSTATALARAKTSQAQPMRSGFAADSTTPLTNKEGVMLEDLVKEQSVPFQELKIQDPRRYFERDGPAPAASTTGQMDARSCVQLLQGVNVDNLSSLPVKLADPESSRKVLLDLSKDGLAGGDELDRHGRPTKAPQEVLQAGVTGVLRQMALAINELLRHFWAAFPPTTPVKAQKLQKLKDALDKQYDNVESMKQMVPAADRLYANQLLNPVMSSMDAAINRYRGVMAKQSQRRGSATAPPVSAKG